jgi:hypothetical protein
MGAKPLLNAREEKTPLHREWNHNSSVILSNLGFFFFFFFFSLLLFPVKVAE